MYARAIGVDDQPGTEAQLQPEGLPSLLCIQPGDGTQAKTEGLKPAIRPAEAPVCDRKTAAVLVARANCKLLVEGTSREQHQHIDDLSSYQAEFAAGNLPEKAPAQTWKTDRTSEFEL